MRFDVRDGGRGMRRFLRPQDWQCPGNDQAVGYLIASSQGNSTYKVYDRRDGNRFLLTIQPRAGRIPVPKETDGIAVTSCPTSRDFPGGHSVLFGSPIAIPLL